MTRLSALLAMSLVLALGLVQAGPLSAMWDANAHQRAHEQKGQYVGLESPGVPNERVVDVECVDGKALNFQCDGIDLVSFTPSTEMTASAGTGAAALGGGLSDIWGWVDPQSGDEYVIFGKTDGAAFYRITDPRNPVYLGDLPSRALAQLIWFDMKVYNDHVYIVSESAPFGMQVFDLTRLRSITTPRVWTEDFFYPLSFSAHNIALNEESGRAYIVGGNAGLAAPDQCLSGLHIVDLQQPDRPVFAGCHAQNEGPGTGLGIVDDGTISPFAYIHDTHCIIYDGPDTEHTGKEICINSSEVHVSIVDVTNPLLPVQLSVVDYPRVGYTHQGWTTEDRKWFLMGDEGDESGDEPTRTLVFDIEDLDNPEFSFEANADTVSIDHNMYVVGDQVYQSNYTTGLRVKDVRSLDEGLLPEIAFFDTWPADDANPVAEFAGTWSNYPYFPSGIIAVTGTEDGLFLLEVQDEVFEAADEAYGDDESDDEGDDD